MLDNNSEEELEVWNSSRWIGDRCTLIVVDYVRSEDT